MSHALVAGGDWQRDLPDHRDYTPSSNPIRRALRRLRPVCKQGPTASKVDWREYCPPATETEPLAASGSRACVAMAQYFERRSSGRLIEPSLAFVDRNARRLTGSGSMGELAGGSTDLARRVSLRATLKAMIQFGLPPKSLWPSCEVHFASEPPAFAYSFTRAIAKARYCRLDGAECSGAESLSNLRQFLAAGFVCVLGFPLSNAEVQAGEIPFPTLADSIRGGQTAAVVGYDDDRRIRSDKGALLILAGRGRQWELDRYGWLPYSFVRQRLAVDIWTLLKRNWLQSGEFSAPCERRV
jgi:hypothetical protein